MTWFLCHYSVSLALEQNHLKSCIRQYPRPHYAGSIEKEVHLYMLMMRLLTGTGFEGSTLPYQTIKFNQRFIIKENCYNNLPTQPTIQCFLTQPELWAKWPSWWWWWSVLWWARWQSWRRRVQGRGCCSCCYRWGLQGIQHWSCKRWRRKHFQHSSWNTQ